MHIAIYQSAGDSDPETLEMDWSGLKALLGHHRRRPNKDGVAWSPVELSPCPPTCRNAGRRRARDCGGNNHHRLSANVRRIHAAVFDLDTLDSAGLEAVAGRIEAAGIESILHTTHSYAPPEKAKARLVLRLSRPVEAAEWPALRRELERRYELPADPSTKDLARLYFLPSAAEGAPALSVWQDGAPVNVDALLTVAQRLATAPPEPLRGPPPEEDEEPDAVDAASLRGALQVVKRRYRAKGDPRGDLLAAALAGRPIAEEGERDSRLNQLCSIIAAHVHPDIPDDALLDVITPSISKMPGDEGIDYWLDEARDMLERARERRKERDEARAEFNRQFRLMLAADASLADDAPPEAPDEDAELDADEGAPYTEEQVRRWALEQGATVDEFSRRWIIQKGRSFYVHSGGRYREPISKDELEVSLPRDLARAPVEFYVEDANGNARRRPVSAILADHATVARNVRASLLLQQSLYDPRTQTFHEAVTPLRPIKAKEHPEIDKWLRLLGGPQADKLLDWVATVMRLDRQSCAIYLDGVKGCGKNLLATGLARLWTTGGPTELSRVLGEHNDSLVNCPLVFADEALPRTKGITADMRRLIGSTSRTLRRLYMPPCDLSGALRVIIAGNNDQLLNSGEDLSGNDLDAVAERFLYLPPEPTKAAAAYLKEIGGPPVVQSWINRDMIAEHALWLRETRTIDESGRFLVSGVAREFHDQLAVAASTTTLVCEWLTQYLMEPENTRPTSTAHLVLAGEGELFVNVQAMSSAAAWEKRVPSADVPSATRIGKALRTLAKAQERALVNGKQYRYHVIRVPLLVEWAQRQGLAEATELLEKINGKNETLRAVLSHRGGSLGA